MQTLFKSIMVVIVSMMVCVPAQADDFIQWVGNTSDDWMTAANWSGNNVPDSLTEVAEVDAVGAYSTVLSSGNTIDVRDLWMADSWDPASHGELLIESGASLSANSVSVNQDSILNIEGELVSRGIVWFNAESVVTVSNDPAVTVEFDVTGSDINVQDDASFSLYSDAKVKVDKFWCNDTSTVFVATSGVIEVSNGMYAKGASTCQLNGSVSGSFKVEGNATAIVDGSVSDWIEVSQNGVCTVNGDQTVSHVKASDNGQIVINGTINGPLQIDSTNVLSRIGVNGVIHGDSGLGGSDYLTIAGTITNGVANGVFSINGSATVVIESTAKIYSASGNTWIYDTPSITWMVGEDGSVGTVWNDSDSDGSYTDEVRYNGVPDDFNVDITAYKPEIHGDTLDVRLVGAIQDATTFASNVTFWNDGVEHTDVSHLGSGLFRITNLYVPPAGTVISIQ